MSRTARCSSSSSLSVLPVVLAGLLAACGGAAPPTDCNDGVDNDGDGLIDHVDPGCAHNMDLYEAPNPAQCNDGLDNDGDTLIDLADYGCVDAAGDDETDPTRACNDGVDNDDDGKIDFAEDSGCESPVDDDEFNPAACEDFTDNDGDGVMDYPYEPGCDSAADDDETDPATRPACSDGMDNDLDGLIDYPGEIGCSSAADNDEFNVLVGACGPSIEITDISATGIAMGSFTMARPNELQSAACGGYGGELAFAYSVTSGTTALLITTDFAETTVDTVVYVREECRRVDSELGCDDDGGSIGPGSASTVLLPEVPVGSYYIIVDTYGPGSLGAFKLQVTERTVIHGACDPSNPTACLPGLICRSLVPGAPTTCEYHSCGDAIDNDADGLVDFPFEPGCTTVDDDTEEDPTPMPECGNGIDDDADALIDYPADPGCAFAADSVELDECYPGKTIAYLDPVTGATGSTGSESALTGGTCGGADSAEAVFALRVTTPLTSLTLGTDNSGTGFDTILYVRSGDCATGTEVRCNDSADGTATGSSVTFAPTVGETYFVFVDGMWGAAGTFRIDVSGVIAADEVCDPALTSYVCEGGHACRESVPGLDDFRCRIALCNDGLDNDGDTFIDYPLEPGCDNRSDDDEDFPNPVRACSNGIDDDGDLVFDYPADLGCTSAADDGEIDECVPGAPVVDHPGGLLAGDTSAGTNLLAAPMRCDDTGTTGTSLEQVFVFRNTRSLSELRFGVEGATFTGRLYLRHGDCSVEGSVDECGAFGGALAILSPTRDYYFAVVDGEWGGAGTFSLRIGGTIVPGGVCDATDVDFVCGPGYACDGGTCTPAACNDGLDNDGDTLIDFPFEPGCRSADDDDETDPIPAPQCGDGLDNDADGMIDYPVDDACGSAADDDESCATFGTDAYGYRGCSDTLGPVSPCDDITTTGSVACASDDCLTEVTIPFTFTYYGIGRTSLSVVSNGKIAFPGTSDYVNGCFIENDTIAAYWDDLYPPSGGSVRYQTLGAAPNRRFVVNWHIPHISGGSQYDIRAAIHEGTNRIELCYHDTLTENVPTDSGLSATVGIQGSTSGIVYSCNEPTVTSGLYLQFTPP